jgi:hypothetical protein
MPLDPNKIKELLQKKNAPRGNKGGTGRRKVIDFTDRSYKAWFALEHTTPDDKEFCTNPVCNDPHGKYREVPGYEPEQVVADVTTEEHGTIRMCRWCFTSNWLVKRDEAVDGVQEQLAV